MEAIPGRPPLVARAAARRALVGRRQRHGARRGPYPESPPGGPAQPLLALGRGHHAREALQPTPRGCPARKATQEATQASGAALAAAHLEVGPGSRRRGIRERSADRLRPVLLEHTERRRHAAADCARESLARQTCRRRAHTGVLRDAGGARGGTARGPDRRRRRPGPRAGPGARDEPRHRGPADRCDCVRLARHQLRGDRRRRRDLPARGACAAGHRDVTRPRPVAGARTRDIW